VTRGQETRRLHSAVLDWYAANGRDLAFRRTRDPWAVLVSEVIAQQTQAARAADAWERFMEAFPTPAALAAVSPATVIRAWRGLGYNRRAIALRAAAIRIVEVHGGHVPDTLDALTALPGVGPYTARAVLAFAFDRPVAPLDTNIRRVLDRAIGPLPTAPKARQSTADGFLPAEGAATWSHALMDLGATICVARAPRCDACPIRTWCRTGRDGLASPMEMETLRKKAHRRSPAFPSTTRWLRGRILDRLRDAPDGAWVAFDVALGAHSIERVADALGRLGAEGMIEQHEADPPRFRLQAG
jgi:A/G-specific adenine glycosylase